MFNHTYCILLPSQGSQMSFFFENSQLNNWVVHKIKVLKISNKH